MGHSEGYAHIKALGFFFFFKIAVAVSSSCSKQISHCVHMTHSHMPITDIFLLCARRVTMNVSVADSKHDGYADDATHCKLTLLLAST